MRAIPRICFLYLITVCFSHTVYFAHYASWFTRKYTGISSGASVTFFHVYNHLHFSSLNLNIVIPPKWTLAYRFTFIRILAACITASIWILVAIFQAIPAKTVITLFHKFHFSPFLPAGAGCKTGCLNVF